MRSPRFVFLLLFVMSSLGVAPGALRQAGEKDSSNRRLESKPLDRGDGGESAIAYSVRSDGDDTLYRIDLGTGVATAVGPVGFGDVEGLTFGPDGTLYGVDDATEQLITIDLQTGDGTIVGPIGQSILDLGLTFDLRGRMWMTSDAPGNFYSVDPTTGDADVVGIMDQPVTGLTARGTTIYGLGGDTFDNLVTIDTTNGNVTVVGPLVNVTLEDGGIDFDDDGTLWGLADGETSRVFTIDRTTGEATVVTTVRDEEETPLGGFESLAILSGPIGYSVRSDGDDMLYAIHLGQRIAVPVGAVGFADVEGLTVDEFDGTLYGVDDATDQLITIDRATGAGTAVGPVGQTFTDVGLTFDEVGDLWMSSDAPASFFSLDFATGAGTLVGSMGQPVTGLAARGTTIYGLGGDNTDNLVTIDTATGAATVVGPLGTISLGDGGIDFAGTTLWGLADTSPAQVFTVDPATGAATALGPLADEGGASIAGFESLAIVPRVGLCEVVCPTDLVVPNDPGECGAVVEFEPTVTGDCANVVCTPASGSFFPVGTTTVTCQEEIFGRGDAPGCTFTVTVEDAEAPSIACPADVTATGTTVADCGLTAPVTYPAPTVSDNCPGATVVCSPASGSVFPEGSTTVTCTATDAAGNSASCSFTVTVTSAGVFGVCAVDDAAGDSWSIVTDRASPLYGYWRYRVAATGEVLCGTASSLSYAPGRSLTAADNDDPRFFMNANLNLRGAGTVRVVDRATGRQHTLRDRSLANTPPCS
jgi:hypothetical protein